MAVKPANRSSLPHAADAELVLYRVQLAPASKRGRLLRVQTSSGVVARSSHGGQTCWQYLHGRSAPCDRCPVLGDGKSERGWTTLDPDAADGRHQALQATAGASTAELRWLRLSPALLGLLCRDKLERLAIAARLSQQELRVLSLMAAGFQSKEIASQLSISARTVKFHGTNLLRKLGADSRIGLLKLVLSPEPVVRSISR